MAKLKLKDIGLSSRALAADADAAAKGTVDFGGLFAGLSMFLIGAALVFAAMLFLFTLERRTSQVGLLSAVGWSSGQVRWWLLAEAGLAAGIGAVLGLAGGVWYARATLHGLTGAWGGATSGLQLSYHAQPTTLVIAAVSTLLVMLLTLWWVSRKFLASPPRQLLTGESALSAVDNKARRWLWTFVISAALAVGLTAAAPMAKLPEAVAGMFFGAGAALLTAALAATAGWMHWARRSQESSSLMQIGIRNVVRRPGRSLAAMGMMASGIFLVVAVNAFRMSAEVDPTARATGTGGFALIGESTLPVYEDLNSKAGREVFGLDDAEMKGVNVVPFRMKEGDDASCLNLNAAQQPQLTGVNVETLRKLGAFSFTAGDWAAAAGSADEPLAVVDMNTAMWGLKKGVGDTLDYTDSRGNFFTVKIAALLAGSVLQGKVIIDEAEFLKRYPDAAGYRYFLIDAPPATSTAVAELLTSQLEQRGLAVEAARDRLASYQAVQNTYIAIFTILGGLGVALGTLGLGVLVARHVLERRGELGIMQAIGFLPSALRQMVMGEHLALLIVGVFIGLLSALVAVWPALRSASSGLPIGFLAWLVPGIVLLGAGACYVAVRAALSGRLMDAIRRE